MAGIRRVVSLMLLGASLTLPAAAEPPLPPPYELPPLVATEPLAGAGAVGYRFTVPEGATVGFGLDAVFADASMMGSGIWLFFGPELQFGVWKAAGVGGLEYHVEVPDPVGVIADRPGARVEQTGTGLVVVGFGMPAGEYVVVMGAASDGTFASGSAALYGDEGTTLLSRVVSQGGFLHRERDFRGVNVFAGLGPRAKVIVGAAVEETFQRAPFGMFSYLGDAEVARLTMEGPHGSESALGGFFFAGGAPGDHRFIADADVGIGDLVVWGLSVLYPPVPLPNTGS